MKVAIVRAKYSPFGGAERVINHTIDTLVSLGVKPLMVTRAWPGNARVPVEHRIVNPPYLTSAGRDRGFARAACALLEAEHFDLVQSYERLACCDVFHAVEGVHAEWLLQRQRVLTPMGRLGVALSAHHRFLLGAERRMFGSSRLRAVICVSQMVKREIAERFDVSPDKLKVIYGAIDCEYFHPGLRDQHRMPTRAALRIPPDAPVALFVGSGFERKGVAMFLDVVARLEECHGVIVGHDRRIDRYRAHAAALGIDKRITFTGGIDDVRPYYGAADVFFMPTIYEPFGLAYGEAMACGLPVVASTKAGASDWIVEGANGFVVHLNDVDGLVRAVRAAYSQPAMGLAARRAVLPFTRERIAEDYAAFYRACLP